MTTAKLPEVAPLIDAITERLRARFPRGGDEPCLVGVETGGVWLARRLHERLALASPFGRLDISFHRDDIGASGLNPTVRPSELPWDVAGRNLVLVDDVLYTGRTVRAALNEIFDWGRPRSVTLAVLVSRDGRELPVQADVAGIELVVPAGHEIKLRGPDPLRLELVAQGAKKGSESFFGETGVRSKGTEK